MTSETTWPDDSIATRPMPEVLTTQPIWPFLRIEALAHRIADMTGALVSEQPECVDYMPQENPCQGLSCEHTRHQLGWAPSTKFDDALSVLVEFLRPTTTLDERVQRNYETVHKAVQELVGAREEVPEPTIL